MGHLERKAEPFFSSERRPLRPCPSTPNCVCSEGARANIEPFRFEGDPERAFASLLEFLAAERRVKVVAREGDHARAVARTTFFRDDLELRLERDERCIHVRSASRLGYSDLGVNRRRVESIRARWHFTPASSPPPRVDPRSASGPGPPPRSP